MENDCINSKLQWEIDLFWVLRCRKDIIEAELVANANRKIFAFAYHARYRNVLNNFLLSVVRRKFIANFIGELVVANFIQ